jgi:hypothetical protein
LKGRVGFEKEEKNRHPKGRKGDSAKQLKQFFKPEKPPRNVVHTEAEQQTYFND